MANGDLTKEIENDKIEVVLKWNIQVRQATKMMEEQADGSKKEMTRKDQLPENDQKRPASGK